MVAAQAGAARAGIRQARAGIRQALAGIRQARAWVRQARAGIRQARAWVRQARAGILAGPDDRPKGWMSVCLALAGDLMFAGEDAEASWRAWDIERRDAGLGRAYRDPRFDTLVGCPRCHDVSTTAGGPACAQCSAAGRLVPA
ncbi:MAG TPA: hypothetical protein VGD68_04670 [Streptosporangiaceae bacterium]